MISDVLAVKRVFTAPIYLNLRYFETERNTSEKLEIKSLDLHEIYRFDLSFVVSRFVPNLRRFKIVGAVNSEFARSPFSLTQTLFFRSFRSAICNPKRSHWMGMPRTTNGGRERARKQTLGKREGRSCKHRILI